MKKRLTNLLVSVLALTMTVTAIPVNPLTVHAKETVQTDTGEFTVSGGELQTEEPQVEEELLVEELDELDAEEVYAEEEPELYLAGDSFAEATVIDFDTKYSGTITDNDPKDYYKIELGSSGRVTVDATAMMANINYRFYDNEGNYIGEIAAQGNEIIQQVSTSDWAELTKGTYYFVVVRTYYDGDYNFKLSFSSAQESFTETGYGSNNEFKTANGIETGILYKGQLAHNDKQDFYKMTLSESGKVTLDTTAMMQYIAYEFYDNEGNFVCKAIYEGNSVTEEISSSETIDLTKGTYYLVVKQHDGWVGNYSFKLSFAAAQESFTETGFGTNNTYATANAIKLKTTYKGQLAYNDDVDIYKVTLNSSGILILDAEAMMSWIQYAIYDYEGNEIWKKYYYRNDATGKNTASNDMTLEKGTYYFVACGNKDEESVGNYSFNLNLHVHSYKEIITKATTTKDGKVEQKCSCGLVLSSKTIYYPSIINLSATEYNYDGKVKKPTIKVMGSDGQVIKASNYTVTYPEGRMNAGKYKIKITFKGNYKGTKTVTFTIKPKTIKTSSKTITLSATEYVYNGKVKKPTVKVKDNNGKVMKASDYTITCPKNCKNVGTYKITVTFKGNYKGTATASFTILPKSTAIASLKAESKGFTVKIKKQANQTTGYQIQYSTSSKFNSAVTKTINKNTTVTQKITKLKANKKYYVRVRTYKTVSGKKYYSDWSAAKSVKTKK